MPGDKIKQVSSGGHHTVYLTEQGRCFACGDNHHGQLGVGDNQDKNRPTEINLADLNLASDDKIKQVIVGLNHTVYLTEQGRCFACGDNHHGQLGVGDNQDKNRPTEINLADLNLAPGDKIKQVFISYDSNLYITEQDRCFACGENYCGLLGVGDTEDKNLLTEISFAHLNLAPGDKIKQVSGSLTHTVCLTEQGALFCLR